jgi:hypothetical protein
MKPCDPEDPSSDYSFSTPNPEKDSPLIAGDNLSTLKALQDQPHLSKIQLIYNDKQG